MRRVPQVGPRGCAACSDVRLARALQMLDARTPVVGRSAQQAHEPPKNQGSAHGEFVFSKICNRRAWGHRRAATGPSQRMIAAEAARLAIEDAGLTPADIDGAIDLRRSGGGGDRATIPSVSARARPHSQFLFRLRPRRRPRRLGIASALSFLDRGIAKYVCLMGAVTTGARRRPPRRRATRHGHMRKARLLGQAGRRHRAVSHHSWMAARHMAVYGTKSISWRDRGRTTGLGLQESRSQNDGRPITIEDHQKSPMRGRAYHCSTSASSPMAPSPTS